MNAAAQRRGVVFLPSGRRRADLDGDAAEVRKAVEGCLNAPALPIALLVVTTPGLRLRLSGMIGMMLLLRRSARSQSAS